ncbi:MAG: GDP-mannose 4,6-dehydratase [Bacteroidota bacterium]
MNALIFGASGQDGHYLVAECRRRGLRPIAASRTSGEITCDVSNGSAVASLIESCRPAFVFHLAAHSTTRHDALFEHHATIAGGTLNILEAVRLHCPTARVFIAGSGVQFANDGTPISEQSPFAATSPYAIARIHSVYAARYYRALGIRSYVGYLFHHESPRRASTHVSMMVARAARRIADGSNEILTIGDVTVEKEWTFAGDVVAAMLLLVQQEETFEAVVGSGRAYSIAQWLEACFHRAGLRWQDHVRVREDFVPEYKRLVSSPETMFALGWRPAVDFAELADMMMRGA